MWWRILLTLLTLLANYALAPKIKNEPPPKPDAPDVPFNEEGKEIPVVFGTVEISPFIGWYDGYRTENIYESVSKK